MCQAAYKPKGQLRKGGKHWNVHPSLMLAILRVWAICYTYLFFRIVCYLLAVIFYCRPLHPAIIVLGVGYPCISIIPYTRLAMLGVLQNLCLCPGLAHLYHLNYFCLPVPLLTTDTSAFDLYPLALDSRQ